MSAEATVGGGALLRIAAFSGQPWERAASPAVMDAIQELERRALEYGEYARQLAERIGVELIGHPALDGGGRARALDARRRLHNGGAPNPAALDRLSRLACGVLAAGHDLPAALGEAGRLAADVADLERAATAVVAAEEERLLSLPWELVQATPVIARAVRQADPDLYDDIERRVARGEPWTGKRMRRRSAYLWRQCDRGVVKPTPRAWFAHVSLVHTADVAGRGIELAVGADAAWQWVENLHHGQRTLVEHGLEEADPATLLTLTPLHREEGDQFVAWVPKVNHRVDLSELRVRRTPLLCAVRRVLRSGACSLAGLESSLIPDATDQQRAVLRKFLSHLAGLGVVEMRRPPKVDVRTWSGEEPTSPAWSGRHEGYVDAYRQVTGPLPRAAGRELEAAARQALRVLALIRADSGGAPPSSLVETGDAPISVLDLMQRSLGDGTAMHGPVHRHGWPVPVRDDSGYARLVRWIAEHDGQRPVNITHDVLSDVGAADDIELTWPIDALLRLAAPGSPAVAALDRFHGAAVLDSRFVDALSTLYGPVPQVDAYREFLQHFAKLTGHLLVEVLVPPLSAQAANAVRRARYTKAWTGDPDAASYWVSDSAARFIPLDQIMVRRLGDRYVASVDGQPIWPTFHATRQALLPWNVVVKALLAAAPRPMNWAWMCPLHRSLDAIPGARYLPRITIGDRLVLSCAQWRIDRDDLWPPTATTVAKARRLNQIRRQLALPRYVYVLGDLEWNTVCCDLDSLRCVHAFDRVLAQEPEFLVVTETLPSPDDFPVTDTGTGARLAAELVLRLPMDEHPHQLAARAAKAWMHGNAGTQR